MNCPAAQSRRRRRRRRSKGISGSTARLVQRQGLGDKGRHACDGESDARRRPPDSGFRTAAALRQLGVVAEAVRRFCLNCWQDLHFLGEPCCMRCGLPPAPPMPNAAPASPIRRNMTVPAPPSPMAISRVVSC
ncbi:double zinc ribbon domain-containing protein [Allosphingosinicella sp.]|uniref:double zinc ribbon domain-containing protein n=1 Tax=Allosphingosinicella sp. TaxID=2823234 RepID=UPI002FC0E5B1